MGNTSKTNFRLPLELVDHGLADGIRPGPALTLRFPDIPALTGCNTDPVPLAQEGKELIRLAVVAALDAEALQQVFHEGHGNLSGVSFNQAQEILDRIGGCLQADV